MRYQKKMDELPQSIQSVVTHIVEMAKPDCVILFGSRARGVHRETSDFDLCIKNKKCDQNTWTQLLVEIPESFMTLYPVDLVEYEKMSADYEKQIDKEGIMLYG